MDSYSEEMQPIYAKPTTFRYSDSTNDNEFYDLDKFTKGKRTGTKKNSKKNKKS
jgi:hypothetical protein